MPLHPMSLMPLVPLVIFAVLFLQFGCADRRSDEVNFGAKAIAERLCALGPRVSTTQGSAVAAEWIADQLRSSGLNPTIDSFNDPDEQGEARIFRNVRATIEGTSKKHYLLLSHYDTKSGISPSFVGANDGGSSTALLLALASWYRINQADATLTFAFLDGEEMVNSYSRYDGLHGSRRLAMQCRAKGVRLDGVILLDMVGDEHLFLTIPANSSPKMKAKFRDVMKKLGLEDFFVESTVDMIDDHEPFLQLGYDAIDIIDFEYGSKPGLNDYWHTTEDTPDKLSDKTLDMVGNIVIEMLR